MIRAAVIAFGLSLLSLCVHAQVVTGPVPGTPGGPGFSRLFFNGANSGNGADLTEDTLTNCSTYSIPAGMLANVGDTIHIVAGGALGATTDSKTVRIKMGAQTMLAVVTAAAASTAWYGEAFITKTGANAQQSTASGTVPGGNPSISGGATAVTDTATIAVTVTGQNTTNSVSGSVACRYITVDFQH